MDALPFVDTLFKEYLLFRGFTNTLQAFNKDLSQDRGCGFQAEKITELVFRQLIPSSACTELVEFLDFLNIRFYSRLDSRYEPLVRSVETSLLRHALVSALRAGRRDKVAEFFKEYGSALLSGPEAGEWRVWFALAYLEAPEKDPAFQVYFSAEWGALLELSFSNFIGEVLRCLPLPAVLRFNADRLARRSLQQQVDALSTEVDRLRAALAGRGSSAGMSGSGAVNGGGGSTGGGKDGSASTGVGDRAASPLGQRGTNQQQQQQQPSAQQADKVQQQHLQQHLQQHPRTTNSTTGSHGQQGHHHTLNPAIAATAAGVAATASHRREASLVDWHTQGLPAAVAVRTGSGLRGSSSSDSGLFGLLPESKELQSGSGAAAATAQGQMEGSAITLAAEHIRQQQQQHQQQQGLQQEGQLTRQASYDSFISAVTSGNDDDDPFISNDREADDASDMGPAATTHGRNNSSGRGRMATADAHQTATQQHRHHQQQQQQQQQQQSSALPIPRAPQHRSSGASATHAPLSASWDPSVTARVSRAGLPGSTDRDLATGSSGRKSDEAAGSSGRRSSSDRRSSNTGSPLPWERSSSGGRASAQWNSVTQLGPSALESTRPRSRSSADDVSGSPSPHHSAVTQSFAPRPPAPPVGTRFHIAHQHTECVLAAPLTCAAFSPSGGNVASACEDGSVAIWSAQGLVGDGQRHASFSVGASVRALAWDTRADKVMLIGTAGRGIKAWHADTRRMVADMPADAAYPDVTAMACCPTDPSFVCATSGGGRGRLALWNMRAFKRTQALAVPGDPIVTSLCYSRSGTLIAAGTESGDIHVFDTSRSLQPVRSWTVGERAGGGSSAVSSSSSSSSGGGIGAATQVVFRANGDGGSADCTTLLSLSGGLLQEWSIASPRAPLLTLDVACAAAAVFARHGRTDAAAPGARIPVNVQTTASQGSGAADRANGSSAAVAAATAASAEVGSASGDRVIQQLLSSCHFAVAPDGERVAVACGGSASGCVLLYDVRLGSPQEGQLLLVSELLTRDVVVDWHPSADVLVCGGKDGVMLALHLAVVGGEEA